MQEKQPVSSTHLKYSRDSGQRGRKITKKTDYIAAANTMYIAGLKFSLNQVKIKH